MTKQVSASTASKDASAEGPTARIKSLGEALFSNGLLSGAIAVVAAGFSIWSQIEARKAADRADEAELAFQRYRGERGDQLQIYDRVEKQLGVSEPHGLVISSSYAQLVEDPRVRQVLCQTIQAIAKDRVESSELSVRPRFAAAMANAGQVLKDCIVEAAEEQRIDPQGTRSGQPATVAAGGASVVQAEAPVTEVLSNGLTSTSGWDLDVFWCQSQGEPSRRLAAQVADHLGKAAEAGQRIGGQALGRVRLRSLSPQAQARLAPPDSVPAIIGTVDEMAFALALREEVSTASRTTFKYGRTNAATPWYVSLFTCGFPTAR